jgi:NAD(P)-dependent dehydrogenase (short-subunit alcohol dehydrogenase family)
VKLSAAAANAGIQAFATDAADFAAADALAAEARRLFGTIDGAFLNAGIAPPAALGSITSRIYRQTMDLNVGGVLFGIQALLPLMQAGGSFLMTTSTAKDRGYAGAAIYSASKGALRAMSRSLARELAPRNIRVNSVSPGGSKHHSSNA